MNHPDDNWRQITVFYQRKIKPHKYHNKKQKPKSIRAQQARIIDKLQLKPELKYLLQTENPREFEPISQNSIIWFPRFKI